MGKKSIKTHFDRNVIFTFFAIFLLGLGLLSFSMSNDSDCGVVDFRMISDSYTTEDLIEFKSMGTHGFDWVWDFGDQSETEYRAHVMHQFQAPGLYTVTLKMNKHCLVTKALTILPKKEVINPALVPSIEVPSTIRVGELVVFKNNSSFAHSWEWSFGETAIVDASVQNPEYIYKNPGQKTVLLITNGDAQHAARRKITVLPEKVIERTRVTRAVTPDHIEVVLKSQIPDAPPEPLATHIPDAPPETSQPKTERIEISKPEFKQLIQEYSERKRSESQIRKCFCTTSIPVFNTTGKRFGVGTFFKEIRDKKISIKDVRLYKDKVSGCLKSFTIDMKIKRGLFWKDF